MPKSNLYTRTGDYGTTSLVGGTRVKKNCLRLEAYGTLDEFSSQLGVILSDPACPEEVRGQLREVQNMLFNLGGYLACESVSVESVPSKAGSDKEVSSSSVDRDAKVLLPKVWGLKEEDLTRLESWIDALDEQTPKVNAFVLPGGCPLCAKAHVARCVCRRAERLIISLSETEYVDPLLLSYINRLSDYLFILARYFNFISGVEEITWHKA